MTNLSVINDYIYFTESIYSKGNYSSIYYRTITDRTGLEKQNKPFEWFY